MDTYKILDYKWMTTGQGDLIGVVAIDSRDGDWKAYIGVAPGAHEEHDMQMVAKHGARIYEIDVACAYFPQLDRGKFIVN